MLDAPPPHADFLGTSSQDPNDLQDTLGELNFGYAFNISADETLSSDLAHDAANVHPSDYSDSWHSAPYPSNSILFNPAPYSDITIASPAPSLANLHDSYYHQNPGPMFTTPNSVARAVPRIHVETEMRPFSPASPSYDHHSPYNHSPQGRSPSSMFSHSYPHSSPSSIGSAPPVTPESPYTSISPHTPYIPHLSVSPISPYVATQPPAFDPKDSLITMPREVGSVLEIANAAGYHHGGPFIPQKTYRPHTISDRRRYVDEVELEAPIMFFSNKPTGCGIPLRDALSSRFSTLEGRDDAMFQGRGPSVSIRLNWPGYAPWSRQIPTRDFRSPPQPITRAKLARNVAKTVQRFIQEMENQAMEDPSEVKWRVGTRGIRLEDLILVGLQHVSMGSWQAHVRLVQRPH
ncbi:hypothetical protein V8D89_016116 [Ganoderma adspersum]